MPAKGGLDRAKQGPLEAVGSLPALSLRVQYTSHRKEKSPYALLNKGPFSSS